MPGIVYTPGMIAPRAAAARQLAAIAGGGRLDEITAAAEAPHGELAGMDARDRGFVRQLVRTTLRRRGQIDGVLAQFLERPLPPNRAVAQALLQIGAAQLLFLGTPPHAAVGATVDAASDRPMKGLLNAVLRRVAAEGQAIVAGQDAPRINTPDWLWRQMESAFGAAAARAIAAAHLVEPPLDITVRGDAAVWAARLDAEVLPTGSLRLRDAGGVSGLAGYRDGAWWVQDAAAALPARLLLQALPRAASECRVADFCAAPGGKTAQLAAADIDVAAIDRDPARMNRLRANLARLDLAVTAIVADAAAWTPPRPLDGVLVDAPCTATGTIRRHPDLPWRKDADAADERTPMQDRLLDAAARDLGPGGVLVYCVCSLDPREGAARIERLLRDRADLVRAPVAAAEIGGIADAITAAGDVRTLPHRFPSPVGWDGFFIARLRRRA